MEERGYGRARALLACAGKLSWVYSYLGLSRNLFEEEAFTNSSTDNYLHEEYNGSAKELVAKDLEIPLSKLVG